MSERPPTSHEQDTRTDPTNLDRNTNINRNETLVFLALGASMASGGPPMIALSLLLVDISEALGFPVGVLGQISSFSSFLSIVMALIMSVLAVRYSHKRLMQVGLALTIASIIGTSLSFNLTSIILLYSLSGIGFSMTLPMVTTFIGTLYPADGRTQVMGRLISMRSIASIIAPLITGYIVARSNWRIGFSAYSQLIAIGAILLVSTQIKQNKSVQSNGDNILDGLKAVLRNRSALAYLVAGTLATTPFMMVQVYNGSYLRQGFSLGVERVSQLLPLTALFVTLGLLSSGFLVQRFGLKRVVSVSTLTSTLAYLVYFAGGLPLGIAIIASIIGSYTNGIRLSTSSSLGLLQETTYRGSMMSLSAASNGLGGMLSAMLGGVALLQYGFNGLGYVLGILGLAATGIYAIWVKNE